jgi:hypothetical protein
MDMRKIVKLVEESERNGTCCGFVVRDGESHAGYVPYKLFDITLPSGETPQKFLSEASGLFVLQTDAGTVLYGNESGLVNSGVKTAKDAVFMAYSEGNDASRLGVLALGEGKSHLITKTGVTACTGNANAKCGVVHCGRVFTVDSRDGYRICWSGPQGVENTKEELNGAGYCYLEDRQKGEAVALLEYDGDVLVVRRNGFTQLHALGYAENFSVESTDVLTATIIPQTVAVVNGDVYFYAEDGLYFYDGNDLEQCAVWEASRLTPLCACGLGNWYFACGDIPCLGGRGIICVDVVNKSCCYVRLNVELMAASDRVYAVADGQCYVLEMALSQMDWDSGLMDFDVTGKKTLRCVKLPELANADMTVESDHGSRSFKNAKGQVSVAMHGKWFWVRIQGVCDVTKVRAEVIL